jgi:hypothetical protein
MHRNALIYKRKFFWALAKNRLSGPSKFRALHFKREFRRSMIYSISATIGIDRSIFDFHRDKQPFVYRGKIPSAPCMTRRSWSSIPHGRNDLDIRLRRDASIIVSLDPIDIHSFNRPYRGGWAQRATLHGGTPTRRLQRRAGLTTRTEWPARITDTILPKNCSRSLAAAGQLGPASPQYHQVFDDFFACVEPSIETYAGQTLIASATAAHVHLPLVLGAFVVGHDLIPLRAAVSLPHAPPSQCHQAVTHFTGEERFVGQRRWRGKLCLGRNPRAFLKQKAPPGDGAKGCIVGPGITAPPAHTRRRARPNWGRPPNLLIPGSRPDRSVSLGSFLEVGMAQIWVRGQRKLKSESPQPACRQPGANTPSRT